MQAQGVLHIKIEGQNFTACAGQRPCQICRQGRFSYAAFGEHTQINGMSQSSPE